MANTAQCTQCPECGSSRVGRAFLARELGIVRCAGCGVFFYWPLPSAGELQTLYDREWADRGEHCQLHADPQAEQINVEKNFRPRLRLLADQGFCGRILDVGCAGGAFLKTATASGWDAVGVDLGEEACRRTAAATGCTVYHGDLESAPLPAGSFDVVHASQVIEHVLSPEGFLSAAHRVLRPGGAILLATPIIDPVVYYTTDTLQKLIIPLVSRGRMHPYPWGVYPPYHIFVQSRRSLRMLLEKVGFSVVCARVFPWNSWYKMNLKWRVYYHTMNALFRLLRTGQNIDVLAAKNAAGVRTTLA